MTAVDWIVPFVRPWDHRCLLQIARDVRAATGGKARIRFLTMWISAADALRPLLEEGEEVVFLPALLRTARVTDEDRAALVEVERRMVERCGTPVRTMLDAERFKPRTAAWAEDFMWRHFKVLSDLIPERAVVMSIQVDHLCYWLACDLARSRGGRYFGFALVGRPSDYTQILTGPRELLTAAEAGRPASLPGEAERQRAEILSGRKPAYMYKSARTPRLLVLRHKRALLREWRSGNYFVNPGTFEVRLNMVASALRWAVQRRRIPFVGLGALAGRRFAYLALHMEPEASTWVYGPNFRDQGFWMDLVARSLPADVLLVVKENPKMFGCRPWSFYARALAHPNLRFVEPETSSIDLVRQSALVLTLTGTVAIEAALLGRPAILFARPPFADVLRSLPVAETPARVPALLRELLAGRGLPDQAVVDREFEAYAASLLPVPYKASVMTGDWRIPNLDPHHPEFSEAVIGALKSDDGQGGVA